MFRRVRSVVYNSYVNNSLREEPLIFTTLTSSHDVCLFLCIFSRSNYILIPKYLLYDTFVFVTTNTKVTALQKQFNIFWYTLYVRGEVIYPSDRGLFYLLILCSRI